MIAERIESVSRRRFLRSALVAGVTVAASPFLEPSPAVAGGLFAAPSSDDQKRVGQQAAKQILKQYKEVHDGRARHFQDLGRRLVEALPREDQRTWDFRFHVIDYKDINAFALPGGPMFLFTGLYERLDTDDALAAVTGHEMTHVRKQHWAKAYSQQQSRDFAISALEQLLKVGRTVQTIAGLADNAMSLRYSRDEEEQADQGGIDNIVAAGYNPEGMVHLLATLQRIAGNGGVLGSDFLSDHPLTSHRIDRARQRVADLEQSQSFAPMVPLHYASLR